MYLQVIRYASHSKSRTTLALDIYQDPGPILQELNQPTHKMPSASFYWDAFRQCFFLPAPAFTEQNLPDQTGRVFIVTGGYAGVGKELSKILYQKNGTVYIAGRSKDKYETAISEIKKAHPSADGRLEFLQLDLADLSSIKESAETFMKKEQRLDVLTNNAGVMTPPPNSLSKQGHELQMGTNCLGPFLFSSFLTPLLEKTAKTSAPGSVRVTWAASLATLAAPTNGVEFNAQSDSPKIHKAQTTNYAQSKASNVLLAQEYQRHYGSSGIVSNAWNPGNLKSELQRHLSGPEHLVASLISYDVKYGAYTELFAGWSDDAGRTEHAGKYIGPWGRFIALRDDIKDSQSGAKFWDWCEKETKSFQ